ncbi:TPA: hypothetical protein N0F65_011332 [Lagenidium giganteum]|uniref:GAG-pre-integrase domain-containing protein n=1 Tax=Lagenidium giganteum TaxID=4803 RepID=A0AAV2YN61_9STRA|nr:TPA: hypothetical protein N0F65_011332 [Lagenidium giganteum]
MIQGREDILLPVIAADGIQRVLSPRDVLYVPAIKFNLISVLKLRKLDGISVRFARALCTLVHASERFHVDVPVTTDVDLFVLRAMAVRTRLTSSNFGVVCWHRRLAHQGQATLRELSRQHQQLSHLRPAKINTVVCDSCALAKSTCAPHPSKAARLARRPF